MFEIKGKYTTAKVYTDLESIEQSCYEQILGLTNNVICNNPIAIMPDCHTGMDSCIGFTMKMGSKVSPSIVSVDIGCGMTTFETDLKLDNLKEIDRKIRSVIPTGISICKDDKNFDKYMDWKQLNKDLLKLTGKQFGLNKEKFIKWLDKFGPHCDKERILKSVSTLGGGNHFIECSQDITGKSFITIHTGSRNLGKQVCEYHENVAKNTVKVLRDVKYKETINEIKRVTKQSKWENKFKEVKAAFGRNDSRNQKVFYLENESLNEYLIDMTIAQHYAISNRKAIMENIKIILNINIFEVIESTHNYINFDDKIIRKGAISSYKGEKLIIPLNPKDGTLICEGKGNPDWQMSAPHGAGRTMSRSAAKKEISKELAEEVMEGVYASVLPLDESPLAYKSSKLIEKFLKPTATIINRLTPIINIKANK